MNMVFLEDDDYYKVPNFRQVDFFTNKNLDKNISLLKQSIHRINHLQDRNKNEYYVETKESKSGSSKLPVVDNFSIQSSERPSGQRTTSLYSVNHRINSPFIKLKTEEEQNMRFQYNKIFSKKYQEMLSDNSKKNIRTRGRTNTKSNYVKEKIDEMRSKIFFIKSVYDYTYPQIMVQKLKTMKSITNKIRNKSIELEAKKLLKKPETDRDRLFVRGHNYDYECQDPLTVFNKPVRLRKEQPVKFFKT
jgi:hypothetical protein